MSWSERTHVGRLRLKVALLRVFGKRTKLAHVVRHLGDTYRRIGNRELARPCYVEALSIYRAEPTARWLDLANTLRGFALLLDQCGEPRGSEQLWKEALELYEACNVLAGVAGSSAHLALLAHAAHDLPASRTWLARARAASEAARDPEVAEFVRTVVTQLESA